MDRIVLTSMMTLGTEQQNEMFHLVADSYL